MTDKLFNFAVRGIKAQAEVNKLCHKSDPETSRDTAEKMVKSGALNRQEQKVLETIKYHVNNTFYKTFTAKELVGWRNLDYYLIQRCLSGLHKKGKIERIQSTDRGKLLFYKSGKPIYNKQDGCCVWRLK